MRGWGFCFRRRGAVGVLLFSKAHEEKLLEPGHQGHEPSGNKDQNILFQYSAREARVSEPHAA